MSRLARTPTEEAKLAAEKHGCGFIMLPHGKFTLVDSDCVNTLSQHAWRLHSGGYVVRWIWDGTPHCIYMHREVMGATAEIEIDHKNKHRCDNRVQNLRICETWQNRGNADKTTRYGERTTSKFKGVSRCSRTGKWRARGALDYREVPLGRFVSEVEAAIAYNAWALQRFGEFAQLNVIQ